MYQQQLLYKNIDDKTIVWFSDTNEYIVVEPLVAEILSLLENGLDKSEVLKNVLNKVDIPTQQAKSLIDDIEILLKTNNKSIVKKRAFKSIIYFSGI